jgi:hypothetical protein
MERFTLRGLRHIVLVLRVAKDAVGQAKYMLWLLGSAVRAGCPVRRLFRPYSPKRPSGCLSSRNDTVTAASERRRWHRSR